VTVVQIQYKSTTMNNYIVIIKMHLQNSGVSKKKKYAGRIEVDCWKSQILLEIICL
jgi:hypothetical protein